MVGLPVVVFFVFKVSQLSAAFRCCGCRDKLQPPSRVTLRDLQKSNAKPAVTVNTLPSAPTPVSSQANQPESPDILLSTLTAADPYDSISLADVAVPLESIKPSKHEHER